MDAGKLPFTRTALLFSLAMMMAPAVVLGQSPTLQVSLSLVTLSGNTPVQDFVTSSGGSASPITFSACVYQTNTNIEWLTISEGQFQQVTNVSTGQSGFELDLQVAGFAGQLTPGTYTANVNVFQSATQPAGGCNSGTPAQTISVSWTTGSAPSGGAGTVVASPNALSQGSLTFPAVIQTSFQLTTSSTGSVTFSLSTGSCSTSSCAWIQLATNGGTISAGSPATISVTLNGTGFSSGTLTGFIVVTFGNNSLSIPVTFGNGVLVSSSGGTSTGSLTLSVNPLSMTYVSGSTTFPNATVTLNGNSGLTFNASASSTNNWLLIDGTTNIEGLSLPQVITVSTNSNAESLSPGNVYTGLVNITASDGSTIQLTVNLTVSGTNATGITVTPNPISLSTPLNGQNASQSVVITSVNGGTVTATVSGSFLSVSSPTPSTISSGSSAGVTITANPAGLSAGTYIGQLNVTVAGNSLTVQVTFTVGSSSSGGTTQSSIVAAPSALTFVYETNALTPAGEQQQVLLTGSGNYTVSVSTTNGGNWLSVSTSSGILPSQAFYVIATPTGLAAGQYSGTVTFTNTSTSVSAAVSVTLYVSNSTEVWFNSNPGGDLIFNYIAGTTALQQFQLLPAGSTDGTSIQVTASVSNPSSTPWLTVSSSSSSSSSALFDVTANATNLANGVYTGFITVTASNGNGTVAPSPLTVPVVLSVVGSSISSTGTAGLTLGTSSITLQAAVNGSTQTTQLTVSAASATSFTASATTNGQGNSTWLSISPSGSLSTNTTITVSANPVGLSAGTYNGTITLSSGTGSSTVPVTFVVGGSGTGVSGNITVSINGQTTTTPSLTFTAQSLGATVASQALSVSSAAGSTGVTFVPTVSGSSCGWVVATGFTMGDQYATPNNLEIGANTAGLAAGTYTCTLTLTPTGGTAVAVTLTLTIIGTPTISVATTSLTFTYSAGSAPPSAQTFQVTGAGSSAAAFTATAATSSGGNWLSVSPASGTATAASAATVTVTVNPASLAVGSYTGTISIAAGSGTTGSGSITVTLTVTAPTPVITTVVNGASFLGGAVAPGEFVSFLGSSLGPLTPLGPSIGSNGNVTTSQGQVQVFFGGTAAPLTYVSSAQINCTVPYEVAGASTITVQVKFLGQPSNSVTLNVANSAPGIFSATGSGTGQGAILNQNSTLNTAGNGAAPASIIQIFMTGEGVTSPAGTDGAITANATTAPVLPIAVKIGGQPATVVFAGEAPGIIAGVLQVNAIIPQGTPAGAQPVVVTIGSNSSQANLTVSVN